MVTSPVNILVEKLNDVAQIWDTTLLKWIPSYRRDFKRQQIVTFLNDVEFNATVTTFTGPMFFCPAYSKGLLLINKSVTSTPTDIVVRVQFSDDAGNFFRYAIGPFGDLRFEDSAGTELRCYNLPIEAPWMRIVAVATGTSGTNKFNLTAKVVFNS